MDAAFCVFDTAIGPCGIAWRDGWIAGVQLPEGNEGRTRARMRRRFPVATEATPPPDVAAIVARVRRSLEGKSDPMLDVALDWTGVAPFQQRVYEVTRAIAPGRTLTYGELATAIGEPGAARAVGQACGANPLPILIPCHRVLAANGLGGFMHASRGAPLDVKTWLLAHERRAD